VEFEPLRGRGASAGSGKRAWITVQRRGVSERPAARPRRLPTRPCLLRLSPTPRAKSSVKTPTRRPMTTAYPATRAPGPRVRTCRKPSLQACARAGSAQSSPGRPTSRPTKRLAGRWSRVSNRRRIPGTSGAVRPAQPVLTLNQVTDIDAPPSASRQSTLAGLRATRDP